MAHRYNHNTGEYEDSVFEKGHEITDEEITRSRGNRRAALKEAQKLQQQGFQRLKDLEHVDSQIRGACLYIWPKEDRLSARTEYIPRGYYGNPAVVAEQWIRCPIEGVQPWQVMKIAELNYKSRPMYRASWEAKLALEMDPDEIEVELMMHSMAGDQEKE